MPRMPTYGEFDLSFLEDIMGSPQRFKEAKMSELMRAIARHKPWAMKPGPEQQSFYETYAKYEPPLSRQLFRREKPEYLIPPAGKGGVRFPEGKYGEPEGGVYFEEPAQPPVWTEKQLGEVNALADRIYGTEPSEKKSAFVEHYFGAPQKYVSEQRAADEAAADIEAENVLTNNPQIREIKNPIARMNAILEKMNPAQRAPFRRSALPRAESEARIGETERAHKAGEEHKGLLFGIAKDREKRRADHEKFWQDLENRKLARLQNKEKAAMGAKTSDAALKAAQAAYKEYLVEYRWEVGATNKLQNDFTKRAQAVGDTEFVPQYRDPSRERPMTPDEWLRSDEGYIFMQKGVQSISGVQAGEAPTGQVEVPTQPLNRTDRSTIMNEIRQGSGIPLKKK